MKYIVGVDLGGSHIKTVLTDNKLNILKKIEFPLTSTSKKDTLKQIFESIYFVLTGISREDVKGIGIAVPGIDDKNKVILPNLPEFNNVDMLDVLEKEFELDIFMDNDGNCAALAEKSKCKEKNIVVITLGTGIGCGIIINNLLYEGRGNAGEFSHISLFTAGSKCSCGNYGCLEEYVSTRGILKIARKIGLRVSDVSELTHLAKKGNVKAKKTFELVGTYLGIGFSDIVKIIDPDKIIVGGGISNAGNFILKPAVCEMKKRTFFKTPPVVLSKMKEDAVVIGAASLFLNFDN